MGVFLLLSSAEAYLPGASGYAVGYAVKVLTVAIVAWYFRSTWTDLRPAPSSSAAALAVMVGLVVFVLWVRLEGLYPSLPFLGKRTGFDPGALPGGLRWPFLAIRFAGLVLLVPLIEELFWRSFLMRWIIDPDYWKVPIGRVTLLAAAATAGLFALAHPEWLPALLTGLLWAWLLWQTRSISACVLSHAVANLALGLHVMATGDWKFW